MGEIGGIFGVVATKSGTRIAKLRQSSRYKIGRSHLRVTIPPHILAPPDRQPTTSDPSRLRHGPPSYRSPTVAVSPTVESLTVAPAAEPTRGGDQNRQDPVSTRRRANTGHGCLACQRADVHGLQGMPLGPRPPPDIHGRREESHFKACH